MGEEDLKKDTRESSGTFLTWLLQGQRGKRNIPGGKKNRFKVLREALGLA